MTAPTRKIAGTQVSALGYGAMGIAAFYGSVKPDEERFKVLDAIYESGCRNWDTADVYMDSEELLGKWFARTGKRSEIFLASKFGFKGNTVDGSPEYMRKEITQSFQRLQTDYLDLYYLHRPDVNTPIEVTVGAMAELVKEGKVKNIGLSEVSANTLRRAYAVHPIAAVQLEYSPFTLDIEDPKVGLLAAARELGVTVVAYSPLGRGLLTGKYSGPEDFEEDDFRRKVPRYSKENFPNILKLSAALADVGKAHGASAGQVALAWLLAQGPDVIPIPGTSKIENWKENMGALQIKLTLEDLKKVREAAEYADKAHQGDRYPPGMWEAVYAETPELKK